MLSMSADIKPTYKVLNWIDAPRNPQDARRPQSQDKRPGAIARVFKRMGVPAPGKRFKLEPREVRQLLLWAPKGDWRRGRQEMETELARFGCAFKYDGGYVIEKGRTPAGM
jgi:hypothetical protein